MNPCRHRSAIAPQRPHAARRARLRAAVASALGLSLALVLGPAPAAHGQSDRPLRLAYVSWSSSVASHNVVKAVLEEHLGVAVRLRETSAEGIWAAVAEGRADATLSAWLPRTHARYRTRYGAAVADLGPNLEGVRTGLVVPAVRPGRQTGPRGQSTRDPVQVDSVADLRRYAATFDHRIVGIDPDAGVMNLTRKALEVYGLDGFRLVGGSEAGMVEALERAIRTGRHVVITGWQPHWMFARWNLKFLADPENVYGTGEAIHTLARPGLREERPRVAALLDNFHWSVADMERLLIWNRQGDRFPYENALRWTRLHPEQVQAWLP